MLMGLLLAICMLLMVLAFLLLPGESSMEQRAPFWGVNFAHRGLHSRDLTVPENSLAAFTAAVDAGYGIELDLQLSSDGEVVVFHDDTLERVCAAEGRLDAQPWQQLKTLRLHGTQQRIPLLREVLDLVDGQVPLIIELKSSARHKQLCESAWRILRTYDGDFCVESFDPRIVRWFYKKVPGLLRGQLCAAPSQLKQGLVGLLVGSGLTNCLCRPQFIAQDIRQSVFTVRLARHFCMRVAWTARSEEQGLLAEQHNDAVIFEHYAAQSVYIETPDETLPPEE